MDTLNACLKTFQTGIAALFPRQLFQHRFNGVNPRFHIVRHCAHAQFVGAGHAPVFVALHQHDDVGGVEVVVFAEGEGNGFAGGINRIDAHRFGA